MTEHTGLIRRLRDGEDKDGPETIRQEAANAIEVMHEALAEIADQKASPELRERGDWGVDFEVRYDFCVNRARKALAQAEPPTRAGVE